MSNTLRNISGYTISLPLLLGRVWRLNLCIMQPSYLEIAIVYAYCEDCNINADMYGEFVILSKDAINIYDYYRNMIKM